MKNSTPSAVVISSRGVQSSKRLPLPPERGGQPWEPQNSNMKIQEQSMRTESAHWQAVSWGDPQPLPSIVMPEDSQDEADLAMPGKQGVYLTAVCWGVP